MQEAYGDITKQNHWGTHTHRDTHTRGSKQLCGESGMPPQPPIPSTRVSSSTCFCLFFPFFFFSPSLFSFQTLNFSVQRCCWGANRLFCQIAANFKVCLTCTLGRPALGASESHTETWGRVLKAPCVSTLLTFKGAHSLLTLTRLLWIKYVSSLSQLH